MWRTSLTLRGGERLTRLLGRGEGGGVGEGEGRGVEGRASTTALHMGLHMGKSGPVTQGTTHYNTVIAKYGALFRPYFYATSYMTEYGLL